MKDQTLSMLVAPRDDHLVLVAQHDHALHVGELAARWPVDGPLTSALVTAARIHDNGWREADAQPAVDADGMPQAFTTVDDATYARVWRRGIARAEAVDPMVGLLVGLHGARFFGSRDSKEIRDLDAAERVRQDAVLAELGLTGRWDDLPPQIALASDRLALLDAVSLVACGAIPRAISLRVGSTNYAIAPTPEGASVHPWPLTCPRHQADVPCRRLPRGPYRDTAALRAAWDAAAIDTLAVVTHPA